MRRNFLSRVPQLCSSNSEEAIQIKHGVGSSVRGTWVCCSGTDCRVEPSRLRIQTAMDTAINILYVADLAVTWLDPDEPNPASPPTT